MITPLDLTISIPVRNEEKNLSGCLEAIGHDFARHIVVIDSSSTDSTCEQAIEFGAEVVDFAWDGKFPKKRNWYLRNHTPNTKWILFLDADEYLTEDFKNEVRKALRKDDKAGYWLNYTVYFLGKQLRGGYPMRKLALFRVGSGEYEQIEEDKWSQLDMEVHEHPVIRGEIGIIKSKIDHKDLRGISHYVLKHCEYAAWEAARLLKSTDDSESSAHWTWRQRLKYSLMRSVLIGPAFFIGSYIIYGGFRDGARGLAVAILKMSYFTQVYCKIRESRSLAQNIAKQPL
ncbi:glycosyltransferase family 2 protein [Pontibacter ramchanderi]|uniref:Glycosyltransferase involved in cell wall biosynthesis n=1 Tax=Pontibacter ramchanderi TaxID=1179743 RepID=A0A2N3V1N8_9BACT|nr:glycosyltransferase family 2 protein [Pontibacter ramchanderi]PKV75535.1 glycosyltransferase involved in cell wall biosynthesis [Pontibacter ramchanderi]